MNKLRVFAAAVLAILAVTVSAQKLPEPISGKMVNDFAGKLSADDQQKLEVILRDYEKRTSNEIAFVTVPSLDGVSVEEYTNKLFHKWGVGKKGKDNGVMFLWAPTERKVRIEVGYGLEGSLPDGRAGQIYREQVLPKFRENNWHDGVFNGVNAIIAHLDSVEATSKQAVAEAPKVTSSGKQDASKGLIVGAAVSGVLIVVGLIFFLVRRSDLKAEEDAREAEAEQRRVGSRKTYPVSAVPPTHPSRARRVYPVPVPIPGSEPRRSRHEEDDDTESRNSSFDSGSSSLGGSSDSGFGGFGGGDSGGGGASGSY